VAVDTVVDTAGRAERPLFPPSHPKIGPRGPISKLVKRFTISWTLTKQATEPMMQNALAVRPLTQLETETLADLALGRTQCSLARQYGVSRDTIKSRIRSITVKLGAQNTAHAVYIASRQGII
jgi:DNA-binding NarL/FixJ family response regulator